MTTRYFAGEKVVYLHDRSSSHPEPASKNVFASRKGEQYEYQVEKYLLVIRVLDEDFIEAISRSGNIHLIDSHDPRLRKATWWERFFKAKSFPQAAGRRPASSANIS